MSDACCVQIGGESCLKSRREFLFLVGWTLAHSRQFEFNLPVTNSWRHSTSATPQSSPTYHLKGMEAAVNSLPSEILERIFSNCTHSDLIQSVQNVCCRWREVAQSTSVWKHVTYCPDEDTRSEQVVEMLKISPKLQNIILCYHYNEKVLQAITDNCAELRKLAISSMPGIDMNFIKELQEKCPNIEYLNIPHPVVTDLRQCEVAVKFTNLKVLHLTGYTQITFSLIFKPVADYCKKLEHLEIRNYTFKVKDLHYLLTMRKDTLHTLGVSCCDTSGECVLPALSTCELKSLSLFYYSRCERHHEKVEHFGRLKTVRALSFKIFSSEDGFKQIFENGNMAQLVELSLEGSGNFDSDDAELIVRNCPLLKNLSLKHLKRMTDATLKIMSNLKELNSLSISPSCRVTDTGISHLQSLKCLKHLTISWCELRFGSIAKLSTLESLTLEFQDLIDFPWDQIHHLQYLRYLYLPHCVNVDMRAVEKLKIELPCLKVFKSSEYFASEFCLQHLHYD